MPTDHDAPRERCEDAVKRALELLFEELAVANLSDPDDYYWAERCSLVIRPLTEVLITLTSEQTAHEYVRRCRETARVGG